MAVEETLDLEVDSWLLVRALGWLHDLEFCFLICLMGNLISQVVVVYTFNKIAQMEGLGNHKELEVCKV